MQFAYQLTYFLWEYQDALKFWSILYTVPKFRINALCFTLITIILVWRILGRKYNAIDKACLRILWANNILYSGYEFTIKRKTTLWYCNFVIYLTTNNAYNESFSGYSVTLLVITIFKSGAMRTKFNQLSSFFCRRKVTTILLISNMCHLKRYTILYVSRVHIMKPKM